MPSADSGEHEALLQSEKRYRAIVENARDYAIFSMDAAGTVTDWLGGAETVFGWGADEIVGRPFDELFIPEDRANGVPALELGIARDRGSAPDVRWHQRKDGQRVFIEGKTLAMRAQDGSLLGFLKIGQDVTERRNADDALRDSEQRLRIVNSELQHRTRNLIAVVRAIALGTMEVSSTLEDFNQRFAPRLDALSRVQGLLSHAQSSQVDFERVLRAELNAHGALESVPSRVQLDGPPGVSLLPTSVQTVALALHELATNAVKYGALSPAGGRLAVSWELRPGPVPAQDRLHIEWHESGVAMPSADTLGSGYGRELIEHALPYQLGAATRYTLRADGVHCSIDLPLAAP